jgi:hypothetical protein
VPSKKAIWVGLAVRGRSRMPAGGLRQKKERKWIPRATKAMASRNRKFAVLSKEFLNDHPWCAVFPRERATSTHHSRGRDGPLLFDERFFVPTSAVGHAWIDANRNEAREFFWHGRPVLAARGDWGRSE